MVVPKASAPTLEEHETVNSREVLDDLTCLGILDDGPGRYRDFHVVSVPAIAACAAAVSSVFRTEAAYDLQMSQSPQVVLDDKDEISALSAVSTIGAAFLDEFLSSE